MAESDCSCDRAKAQRVGALMCAAMREKLSRQMFEVVIQAAANGKVIARETLKVNLPLCHACNGRARTGLSSTASEAGPLLCQA